MLLEFWYNKLSLILYRDTILYDRLTTVPYILEVFFDSRNCIIITFVSTMTYPGFSKNQSWLCSVCTVYVPLPVCSILFRSIGIFEIHRLCFLLGLFVC